MCQVYSTKKKIDLVFGDALEYKDFYATTSYMYISLNFLIKNIVWTPYWLVNFKPTYSLFLLFQFFWNFVFDFQ